MESEPGILKPGTTQTRSKSHADRHPMPHDQAQGEALQAVRRKGAVSGNQTQRGQGVALPFRVARRRFRQGKHLCYW